MLASNQSSQEIVPTRLAPSISQYTGLSSGSPVSSRRQSIQLEIVWTLIQENMILGKMIRAIRLAQSKERSSAPEQGQAIRVAGLQLIHNVFEKCSMISLNQHHWMSETDQRKSILYGLMIEACAKAYDSSQQRQNPPSQNQNSDKSQRHSSLQSDMAGLQNIQAPQLSNRSILQELLSCDSVGALQNSQPSQVSQFATTTFPSLGFRKSQDGGLDYGGRHPYTCKQKLTLEQSEPDRKRKTKYQLAILNAQLRNNPHWSIQKMRGIAVRVGLEKNQVYKWWWDKTSRKPKRDKNSLRGNPQ